jgi:hypothetical protein
MPVEGSGWLSTDLHLVGFSVFESRQTQNFRAVFKMSFCGERFSSSLKNHPHILGHRVWGTEI